MPPVLVEQFFLRRLGRDVPADLDVFIREIGLESREAFYSLLRDEHVYSRR
jgi:hypothetical protein